MPRIGQKVRFTKRFLDGLVPKQSPSVLSVMDTEIDGFGIQVYASGIKTFFLKYSINGRQRWLTLGRFGTQLTLEQARIAAREAAASVTLRKDPVEERKRRHDAPTVNDLVEKFLTEHVQPKLKPKTSAHYTWILKKHALPHLGALKAESVDVSDIRRLHHRLASTPRVANTVVMVLGKMFKLSEQWGVRRQNTNPCSLIERFNEPKRVCRLEDHELERLSEAMEGNGFSKNSDKLMISAVRLFLLTGARRGEILNLRWDQVDLEKRILRLPDSKTGAKAVPLGEEAIAVIQGIPRLLGNPMVFQYSNPESAVTALKRLWSDLRVKAELPDLRIHDLRHVFASQAIDSGLSLEVIAGILGQKTREVTERYAHMGVSPVIAGADQASGFIAAKLRQRSSR